MFKRAAVVLSVFAVMSVNLYAADHDIKVNSIGFIPDGVKGVTSSQAAAGFDVIDVSDSDIVFSGTFGSAINASDSGETLYRGDFTSFETPGTYYVNVTGVGRSVNFTIADDVYNEPFYVAIRAMYLWRCGMEVSAQHDGFTFSHEACHLNDANQIYTGFGDNIRDGKCGWHDAGDFNKYTVNTGVTMGSFLMAWEHFGNKIDSVELDYMPSTVSGYPDYQVGGYPDYLKEMRWQTDWLLKMAYPDGSGKVSHKLSALNFSGFIMPEDETATRYYCDWGSAATASFTAVLAMAARVFYPYDADYAQQCLDAALQSYDFLVNNTANKAPDQSPFSTGGYTTNDSDDRLWAAAEIWATTGDAGAHTDFVTRANGISNKITLHFDWGNVQNLAMYTYINATRTGKNASLLNQIETAIISNANSLVNMADSHGYGRPLGTSTGYYWGSNGLTARQAILLQMANIVSPNQDYVDTALDTLGFLLGRNYFRRSFVTGMGHQPPLNPHDRPSGATGRAWPGYLVGGSPGSAQDSALEAAVPDGSPPAHYWVDDQASYASNEIAINWQAALVYAMAGFVQPPTPTPTWDPSVPTYTPTPTATPTATPGFDELPEMISVTEHITYPNPSDGSMIKVRFKTSGRVEELNLSVYTYGDRLVGRTQLTRLEEGEHDIVWNPGSVLANGIYYYVLEARNDYMINRKTGAAVVIK